MIIAEENAAYLGYVKMTEKKNALKSERVKISG